MRWADEALNLIDPTDAAKQAQTCLEAAAREIRLALGGVAVPT